MLPSMKFRLWFEYCRQKAAYASVLTYQKCNPTHATMEEFWKTAFKHLMQEKITYLFQSKGIEMAPTISAQETLIVRKLPCRDTDLVKIREPINVGDVIVMKDPLDSDNFLVRRLAALEGHEMVSTNKEDEPFVLEDGQCWVLSDNKVLTPKELKDSRTYGPVSMTDIVGRVIFRYRNPNDHSIMVNNKLSMSRDMPVLYAERHYINIESAEKDDKSEDSQR